MTTHNPHYLLTLPSVRQRCSTLAGKIKSNKLTNFDVDLTRLPSVIDLVCDTITQEYEDFDKIPPHGRWQHFEAKGIARISHLVGQWHNSSKVDSESSRDKVDDLEVCRRLVELFFVSVLLDAGAGNQWKYSDTTNNVELSRSEGLAVACLNMYTQGVFSASGSKFRVDGPKLAQLDIQTLSNGMQSGPSNPLAGIDGRLSVLNNLGSALSLPEFEPFFGNSLMSSDQIPRLGNLVDFLVMQKSADNSVDLFILWDALMRVLERVWPAGRTQLEGISLGDAWPCTSIAADDGPDPFNHIVPFHKLTQWLTYSLMTPIEKFLDVTFTNQEHLTGLPEYRNGGLLVDMGVLELKKPVLEQGLVAAGSSAVPLFPVDSDAIVEWRAVTVVMLDKILVLVNDKLKANLTLAQLLEAGTWKAGRIIAAQKRPTTSGPPIDIISDGTVF